MRFQGRPRPTTEEANLFDVACRAIEAVEATGEVQMVGRVILFEQGIRDHILYCRDRERTTMLLQDAIQPGALQLEFARDPKWSQFDDLLKMARSAKGAAKDIGLPPGRERT